MTFSKIFQTIIIIFFLLSSQGCNKSKSNSTINNTTNTEKNEILTSSKTIGSSGGVVSLQYSDKKALAVFPENALNSDENIVIKRNTALPASLSSNVSQAGDSINYSPEGIIFNKNITLGIPYFDKYNNSYDSLGIKYYDPILGDWTEVQVKSYDPQNNIIYFESNHFSNYIAYIEKEMPYYPSENDLVPGEYFTGSPYYYTRSDGTKELRVKGCINRSDLVCAQPWHLSMYLYQGKDLIKIIDREFTLNHLSGYPAQLSNDGSYITFNAMEIFEKVKESGDARLWDWQCEFVTEHTRLVNYRSYSENDPRFIQDQTGDRIYAQIDAVDKNNVRIGWQINIVPEIKATERLSIRFEARYDP
jgi:hypothetical protein